MKIEKQTLTIAINSVTFLSVLKENYHQMKILKLRQTSALIFGCLVLDNKLIQCPCRVVFVSVKQEGSH